MLFFRLEDKHNPETDLLTAKTLRRDVINRERARNQSLINQ